MQPAHQTHSSDSRVWFVCLYITSAHSTHIRVDTWDFLLFVFCAYQQLVTFFLYFTLKPFFLTHWLLCVDDSFIHFSTNIINYLSENVNLGGKNKEFLNKGNLFYKNDSLNYKLEI